MLEQMIAQESAKLYMQLLERSVKDKYRGHRDYHLMIQSIRSDLPLIGGEIKLQKEDGNGNFYTENYHVTVLDDLGNPLHGVDDLGGQCMKGEIVKRGFIFSCLECGQNFCRKHVKFVDKDFKKPLCRYDFGFFGWNGCYSSNWKEYSIDPALPPQTNLDAAGERLKLKKILLEEKKLDRESKALDGNVIHEARPVIGSPSRKSLLRPQKKRGVIARLFSDVSSVSCGNPYCDKTISLQNLICSGCSNTITIRDGDAFVCPHCTKPIKQVECPKCGSTSRL